MQLVNATTTQCVRKISKLFIDRFKKEFDGCVVASRGNPNSSECCSGSEDEDSNVSVFRHTTTNACVIDVKIGGFDVSCLNNRRQIVLKLCDATMKFIEQWMVPLVRELARSQVDAESSTDARPSDSVATLANFHFTASNTPNVRDKVFWNPSLHTWEVNAKKPKGELSKVGLVVDKHLGADEYEQAKVDAYSRAITAWNDLDGSTRHRLSRT
jgi:hypothetical protein